MRIFQFFVRKYILSRVTCVVIGALYFPSSFQSGSSSSSALGSNTFPDKICDPISSSWSYETGDRVHWKILRQNPE